MGIAIDSNGFGFLNIPAEGENFGKKLPTITQYLALLNDKSFALSSINSSFCVTDPRLFDGVFIQNAPDEFGVILGHEFNPFIYRGQNKDFPHFLPKAKRYKKADYLTHCIDWIKKQEFLRFFKATPYYERCQQFHVLGAHFKFDLEAIAQHYDFLSDYIDITKDLMIAMFFAYTYQVNGKYYPVEDFDEYSPTLYIGNLKEIFKENTKCLKIIGFQALLRPFLQKAMAIEIKNEDVFKPLFQKVELPKSPVFSHEIFNRFAGGQLIFPDEYIEKVVTEIKSGKKLDENFLQQYCENFSCDYSALQKKLKEKGYALTSKKWDMPQGCRYAIHKEIDNIIYYLDSKIGYRGICDMYYPNETQRVHK